MLYCARSMSATIIFIVVFGAFSSQIKHNAYNNAGDKQPISLNVQNIKVRALLYVLAEAVGVNLVLSDAVSGVLTIHLKNVPWHQALDLILDIQGLDKRTVGNVLLVDKAEAFVMREKDKWQSLQVASSLTPLQSHTMRLHYAKATDIAVMLKDKTNAILSERGAVSVDKRTNTLLLQDIHTNLHAALVLVRKLDVPIQQILIEARIVNMAKDCARDLGVRFGVLNPRYHIGSAAGAVQLAQGITPARIPMAERLNVDLGALPLEAHPAAVGIALAKLSNNVLLDLELSALESEGRAEIMASPRLMTVNQQAAEIKSGEDIPYQEVAPTGATAVAFRQAVLSLKVTPQITPDGQLLMDLLINQDSDSGRRVQGVPVILTKSITTNVLVDNGQTIVLGGIYKRLQNHAVIRVPFLGSLPIVGALFRRKEVRKKSEELLIFITPKIIEKNQDDSVT